MIRFLSLALGLTIGVAASSAEEAAESRVVTGALTYQQKIALPPGARAMVRAEGRFGVTLGETEFAGDGLEMPRRFTVEVPLGLSGTVRALIEVNGAPLGWSVLLKLSRVVSEENLLGFEWDFPL